MSGFTNRATDTGEALTAYTAALIELLGDRDPLHGAARDAGRARSRDDLVHLRQIRRIRTAIGAA